MLFLLSAASFYTFISITSKGKQKEGILPLKRLFTEKFWWFDDRL